MEPTKSLASESILHDLCFSCPETSRYLDLQSCALTIDLKIILCILMDFGNCDMAADWMEKPWEIDSSLKDCVIVETMENSLSSIRNDNLS